MFKKLQKNCREKVCRIEVFRTNLEKFGQNILCTIARSCTHVSTVHLLPKDPTFKYGGVKLVSCPGLHLTLERPWAFIEHQIGMSAVVTSHVVRLQVVRPFVDGRGHNRAF